MRFRIVVLAALGWLSACATVENYEASLQTWVGAPEGELIAAWGVPDAVYTLADGAKVVEYVNVEVFTSGGYTKYETVTVDTSSETSTIRVPVYVPLEKHYQRCETRFMISAAGIITRWRHQGGGCRAGTGEAATLGRFGQ